MQRYTRRSNHVPLSFHVPRNALAEALRKCSPGPSRELLEESGPAIAFRGSGIIPQVPAHKKDKNSKAVRQRFSLKRCDSSPEEMAMEGQYFKTVAFVAWVGYTTIGKTM